ncbi:Abi family protein [Sulfuricurvum kujiense DSM 16994]|uniref:Abi family protein n=1 Tax=Sulfuricurvum kujiense (strain ATCC BAA-921 / DSM 16994 / JCM 11577 / YK-1) TaxID=709032 RepID=E4TXL2_SULKY|nr:Abi family protein [Sulfuricurvum kujiense]ADR33921.1 Abi family protein [Sulfuricurvum kujiense DSM 16994]
MTSYNKPHLSYQNQIDLLKNRGLIIHDEAYAITKLKHISYFRLSAYFLPFQSAKDTFDHGITFEQIIDLYHFDKELRLLTFGAIEKIEIFLRTSLAYILSKHTKAFGYTQEENFCARDGDFAWLKDDIAKETGRSKETFIKHFRDNYCDSDLPIWMVVEIISFGTLSKLYSMLCPPIEKEILDGIGLPSFVFKNWLHVFSYVRNLSAHHSRLWNRQFVIKTKIPKHKKEFTGMVNDKYYTFAVMTHHVLRSIHDTFDMKSELLNLFAKYPDIDLEQMGFVDGWGGIAVWK